jgi:hypothetical protein
VVCSGGSVHPRAATEFDQRNRQRRVKQAASGQVLDQGREFPVGRWQYAVLEQGEAQLVPRGSETGT